MNDEISLPFMGDVAIDEEIADSPQGPKDVLRGHEGGRLERGPAYHPRHHSLPIEMCFILRFEIVDVVPVTIARWVGKPDSKLDFITLGSLSLESTSVYVRQVKGSLESV